MLWIYIEAVDCTRISQVALVVKKPPANEGDLRDAALIPGWGRSPGEGNGNPLQCSCLENPMDRGAWWVAVYRIAPSQTRLSSYLSLSLSHTHTQAQKLPSF